MPGNFIDLTIVAIIVICLVYGWHTGLLRQVVAISAVLCALIAASALDQWLGAWWAAAAGLQPPTYLDALAYLLLYLLAASLWLLTMRRVYPYQRLTASEVGNWAWSLDRFGGLLLGGVLGVLVAVSVVGLMEVLVYYRWGGQPGARGVRDIVHAQVVDSTIVQMLLTEAPDAAEFISLYVPGVRIAREGRILP